MLAMVRAKQLSEIDGLRALAIILVIIWHYICGQVQVALGAPGAYALQMIGFTWTGVDIFFVLSAYLVGGMLIRDRLSGRGPGPILIKRCFRILPPYALTVIGFQVAKASAKPGVGGGLGWLIRRKDPLSKISSQ